MKKLVTCINGKGTATFTEQDSLKGGNIEIIIKDHPLFKSLIVGERSGEIVPFGLQTPYFKMPISLRAAMLGFVPESIQIRKIEITLSEKYIRCVVSYGIGPEGIYHGVLFFH